MPATASVWRGTKTTPTSGSPIPCAARRFGSPSTTRTLAWPPEERAAPIELEAGGVAFFGYGTAHCTRANTSDRERAGMAFHFLHAAYAAPDLVEGDRRTRPYVTGPRATGGRAEYGGRGRGHLGAGSGTRERRAGPWLWSGQACVAGGGCARVSSCRCLRGLNP